METWPSKQVEKIPQVDAVAQALEDICKKGEERLSKEFGRQDLSHTRELLTRAYPEAMQRAKNILETKA